MPDNGFIVQSAIAERLYVKIYHDFLDSDLINGKEKLVFILLKRYLNFKYDERGISGEVYPTLDTLAKQSGMSRKTVSALIKQLEKKGVLQIKRQGSTKPNIYTLKDFSEMWNAKTEAELKDAVEIAENNAEVFSMIQKLQSMGYTVTKEKELDNLSASDSLDKKSSTKNELINNKDDTTKTIDSQEEQYNMAGLKEIFEYDIMISDKPSWKADIDNTMEIIKDVVNCRKPTIRVAGENKPTAVVVGKIMKLTRLEILYVVGKFLSQTDRIGNTRNYMITMLYRAKEQMGFDINNMVRYDLSHNDEP